MPESETSYPLSSIGEHSETETPTTDAFDVGSPVPSLIGSTPPYRQLQLPRLHNSGLEHVHEEVEDDTRNRRWNSKSSTGSSRKSVETGAHQQRSGSSYNGIISRDFEDSANSHAGAGRAAQSGSRPKISARNRCSMVSVVSTAPSLQLQTPGLLQDGFPFPHSSLEVSIEDEEEGMDKYGNAGSEDDGGRREGGSKSVKATRAEGTLVAERRRQFEDPAEVAKGEQSRTHPPITTEGGRNIPITITQSERANELSNGEITPLHSREAVEDSASAESPSFSNFTSNTGSLDFDGEPRIGLGLQGLTGSPESGDGWQDEMAALERNIEEAAGSYRKLSPVPAVQSENPIKAASTRMSFGSMKSADFETKSPVFITTGSETSQSSQFYSIRSDRAPNSAVIPATNTPSRASSTNQLATALPRKMSRSGSPFQSSIKTSVSPSQSILNLSQKGLASTRRQQWETSATNNAAPVSPLRLSRHSGSSTPISRTPTRQCSLLRGLQDSKGDSNRSEYAIVRDPTVSGSPSRDLSVKYSNDRKIDAPGAYDQENIDPQHRRVESLLSSAASGSQTINTSGDNAQEYDSANTRIRRKPAPRISSSLSNRLVRSPSQASTMQSYIMASAVNACSPFSGSQSSMDTMKRALEGTVATTPAFAASNDRQSNSADSVQALHRNSVPPAEEASQDLFTTPSDLYSGPATASLLSVLELGDLRNGVNKSATDDRTISPNAAAPSTTPLHFETRQLLEAHEEVRVKPLFVRNPDGNEEGKLQHSPSFQPGVDDASYFNYPTGIGISALPVFQEQPTFSLAKTYSDQAAPFTLGGNGFVIPTSPDLNEQTRRGFSDRVYSRSPLNKSPGKGIMGKMVGAAKKVVQTGIKSRTGNLNRLMQSDRLAPIGSSPKHRIKLDDTSTISLVPSAVQRQEAQELQPHWGQEDYLRQGAIGQRHPVARHGLRVELPPLLRERELPPIPQGRTLLPSEAIESGAEAVGSSQTTSGETREPGEGYRQPDLHYGITVDLADPPPAEEVLTHYLEAAPRKQADDLTIPSGKEEPQGSNTMENVPALPSVRPLMPPAQNGRPVTDERVLSVFKSRKMPRTTPHLTMPALLAPEALGVTHDATSKVVPPVMPVCVPTPVSIIRPRSPEATAPLNLLPREALPPILQAEAVFDSDDFAERRIDPSPTKTERFRKVASWAQEAAIAPPPMANEPQNDNRDAALRRDEDRLDLVPDSFSPPISIERHLPCIPHKAPQASRIDAQDIDQLENEALLEDTLKEEARQLPGGLAMFPELAIDPPSPRNQFDEHDIPRLTGPLEHPGEEPRATAHEMDDELEPQIGRNHVLPVQAETLQRLQGIHDAVQVLQRSAEIPQIDTTFKEAVMANKDQTHEILSKTNALLDMISDIQQTLAGQSRALAISGDLATGEDMPRQGTEQETEGAEIQGPETRIAAMISSDEPRQLELEGTSKVAENIVAEETQKRDNLIAAVEELKMLQSGTSESNVEDHVRLEGYLQQLSSWSNGFHHQMEGDMRNLHGDMQSVMRVTESLHHQQLSLRAGLGLSTGEGSPEEFGNLDLKARLDHLSNMVASIQASSGSQEIVASRIDHVIEVLGGIQNKPEPPPPITTEVLTAIIERENMKHVNVLRSIAVDLVRDMHNERAQMVQELSAATAVEVERHVASMNAQLQEKREELDRLESQRKEMEVTISDLLRLQSRYKGPTSPPAASRPRPVTPARPMPGAMPMPVAAPMRPPSRGLVPPSGRASTRPLPTPSPRPLAH